MDKDTKSQKYTYTAMKKKVVKMENGRITEVIFVY